MKIKPTTLNNEDIETITRILNRGNQCEIKKERDSVVIVEIKRYALLKKPIIEDQVSQFNIAIGRYIRSKGALEVETLMSFYTSA